jgi:predicted ATPase
MILELSKERQVFVTTHNESLCNLLQGFESITIEKQNDFSKIK